MSLEGAPPAREVLAWMRANGARLRALVAEEQEGERALAPGDDPTIRANLRFAAEALEATVAGPLADALAGFAADLPGWFAEAEDLYEDHLATGAGAIALEEHLQFGTTPGTDPSLDAAMDRRLRITGWIRVFLVGLERWLGPAADGLADQALAEMGGRSRHLSRLILSLDTAAKAAARSAGGPVDLETQDHIGQAAIVQGHVRLLIEAVTGDAAPGET